MVGSLLLLILFQCYVGSCLLNITETGVVKYHEPLIFDIPPTNLYSTAMFSFSFNRDLLVCLQENAELPYCTQYTPSTCTFLYELKVSDNRIVDPPNGTVPRPTPSTAPPASATYFVPLRNTTYRVGIYFLGLVYVDGYNATVDARITGDTCDEPGTFWDGNSCDKARVFEGFNDSIPVVFKTVELNLFSFDVPDLVGLIRFSISNIVASTQIWMRREGNPTHKIYDATSNGQHEVAFLLPRPGLWVIAVLYDEFYPDNYTHTVSISGDTCNETGKAGPACTIAYAKAENEASAIASSQYQYWQINATGNTTVSIFSSNPNLLPDLYASKGQLPTRDNSDLSICNQRYCPTVRALSIPGGENETWFVGVVSSWEDRNVTYAIWWNVSCIPGCEEGIGFMKRGSCRKDGSCQCNPDWNGLDCSNFLGQGAWWKVLYLVIGILVFIVLVFVGGWWYRRRRQPVEIGFS